MSSEKDILVIKFGTASITQQNGTPDHSKIQTICRELAELKASYNIVIVSSGAVGAGKQFIENYTREISQLKAAAAIGNPILIGLYANYFSPYGIQVAQSLCERQHFANREHFLQLKSTYDTLWENGIIPVANENDVISDRELKFSDNDELATLIAAGFGAKKLLICTVAGGLLNHQKEIIKTVENINEEVLNFVDSSKSSLGLGGMASKLTFTKLATQMGIETIIFGLNQNGGIVSALKNETGTTFKAKEANLNAKNKWLASGGLTAAQITVDQGAATALINRNSLLAVGVTDVSNDFDSGEIVEIMDTTQKVIAICRVKVSSTYLNDNPKTKNTIIAHANDIVLV